ncbi:MAG: hypothetical protein QM736_20010 [Vicinamibacterales bacterium]
MVRDALQERFDAVCREELDRLRRKLAGLSDDDRASAETVIAHVIGALAKPAERLIDDPPHPAAIDAIVQLFALDASSPSL